MRTCVAAVGVALGLAGVTGLAAILALRHYEALHEFKYGIVFDAGSSGTRLYLYRWPSKKIASTGLVSQDHACRVPGGLSSYDKDPCAAGPSLEACLDQAKGLVPQQQHASTQVYLAATAGMRLLNGTKPAIAEAVMSSVRSTLRGSGFAFSSDSQARIMSGQEEGVASWITINYVKGKLQPPAQGGGHANLSSGTRPGDTYGVLDLGGASTQITFVDYADATPWNYTATITLLASTYRLYSYSFPCYGVNEASNIYHAHLIKQAHSSRSGIEDPCMPRGYTENRPARQLLESPCSEAHMPDDIDVYSNETLVYSFIGTGNASACQSRVRALFDFSSCTFTACWFAGVYMPSNITATDFTAISGYYHITANFQLTNITQPLTTRVEFFNKAVSVCGFNWEQARKEFKREPSKMCFNAQYAYELLSSGYKLGDREWRRIRFAKEVNGTDFNWALGYMLSLTNGIPSLPDPVYYVSQPTYVAVLVVTALLLVAGSSAVAFACKRLAWQKANISEGSLPKGSAHVPLV